MSTITTSPELAAILDAATTQTEWCELLIAALGSNRRVIALHNGIEFRNCALTGAMQASGGSIVGFGMTSGTTVSLGANLSTGTGLLKITGGGHAIDGSLGLEGSGCNFILSANPTATNGLAVSGIAISAPGHLPLGGGTGVPYRIEKEDWSSGAAGELQSIVLDENPGDIVWDDAQRAAETGPIPYRRSTQIFVHGTGGYALEIGMHLAILPPQCNDEVNAPVYEVFGFMKPHAPTRWPKYPMMAGYNPATDSTFLKPCKFRIYDAADNLLGIIDNDGLPLNDPSMGQTRNTTTAWNPFGHTKQMLYWSSHRLKLSANARKWHNGMVPGTSNRPGQARAIASANAAFPALPSGYQQANGFGQWFYLPPYPLTTTETYACTDPYATTQMLSDPDGNPHGGTRNGSWAMGYMCTRFGAPAGHDWFGPKGGNRSDRFFVPSQLTAYLTEPDGVRPQGNVPYKLLAYEYMKGYFHHGHHECIDPRTGAGLPHEDVAYGKLAACYGYYTQQGPIFVAGGEETHINCFSRQYGEPPKDRDGLLPYQGFENDAQHAYHHPAWFAMMYNSVAAVFSSIMQYNSTMMSFGPYGHPQYSYNGMLMQRMHAWRWHNQGLMWKIGSSHPSLLSQDKIEARFVAELEFADDTVRIPATTPAHAEYNSIYNAGLRNFGIPGKEYVSGDTHCISGVDDGKLLYLGGVLATMEATGCSARLRARSAKAGAMVDFIGSCVHTYSVKYMNVAKGRVLFWMNNQISPLVPLASPLVPYSGYAEWAADHAPVNGLQDLVREPNGDPHYQERQQYQHLLVQTIFMFRDFLGGEAKYPGTNAACAIAQEQEDFYATQIANGYGGLFGDYTFRWPAAGIAAAPEL